MSESEIAEKIARQELDMPKLFRWLWDLYKNDPDIFKDDAEIPPVEQNE